MTTDEKIQYYRKKLSLSQEELGQKLLVSRQTVSLWENGQTAPTIDNLIRLREIFGVSVDELLGCETETAENNEEKTDTPVPSESYKVTYSDKELSSAFKAIVKALYLPLVLSVITSFAMLIFSVWMDMSDITIGEFIGLSITITVVCISFIFNFRKLWKSQLPKLKGSEYEYKVFNNYFTVDLKVNGEFIAKEKIYFHEIDKVYNTDEFLLIQIKSEVHILKKADIISNSAFFALMYNKPAKITDKNKVKKLKSATNILFVVTLVILAAYFAFSGNLFTLDYPWLFSLFLPVPIALIVLSCKLRKSGEKQLKNIIVGVILSFLLVIDGALYLFIDIGVIGKYDPVQNFTEITSIALPDEIDKYTVEFQEDTQPTDTGYIYYYSSLVFFDEYLTDTFENSLEHDLRWVDTFPEELSEYLAPLDFDEGHKSADKMLLYNIYSGEYNALPTEEDSQYFIAVFYHNDQNLMEIFEYTTEN